jgi:hypothetical protein
VHGERIGETTWLEGIIKIDIIYVGIDRIYFCEPTQNKGVFKQAAGQWYSLGSLESGQNKVVVEQTGGSYCI